MDDLHNKMVRLADRVEETMPSDSPYYWILIDIRDALDQNYRDQNLITCPHCNYRQKPFEEWDEILCRSCDKKIGDVK